MARRSAIMTPCMRGVVLPGAKVQGKPCSFCGTNVLTYGRPANGRRPARGSRQ